MSTLLSYFLCPICQSTLIVGEKTWQCTANNEQNRSHSFDVAKQGYVNLLPVQHKKSKNPGDSEESIKARERFLQAGFYQPLRQKLQQICQKAILANTTWLDVGCGEGYYTEGFLSLNPAQLIALDISKPAVMATAKRLKSKHNPSVQTYAMVASAAQVPLKSHSVDIITSIFSPILPEEFNRLLAKNGKVFIAKPAQNHLYQMREGLFDEVVPHDSDKFIDELSPFFMLIDEQKISYEIEVKVEQLADLLNMTPYTFRAKLDKRQTLLTQVTEQGRLKLTVDFVIYEFAKK